MEKIVRKDYFRSAQAAAADGSKLFLWEKFFNSTLLRWNGRKVEDIFHIFSN